MKYEVGMRWILAPSPFLMRWRSGDDHPGDDRELRGYIIDVKPRVGKPFNFFITIKWENGKIMQYTDDRIKDDPRLSLDKVWYRNEKLKLLGI